MNPERVAPTIALAFVLLESSWAESATAAAREVFEFAKTHKGVVSIVGGVYENTYLGSDAMLAIATIPGRDVLYTQLVSVLIAPIQKFATALAEIAKAKA